MDIQQYKYKTELHAHTKPASNCGCVTADEVVRKYADLGYDSIVICNHFYPGMPYVEDKEKCIDAYLADYSLAAETGKKLGINVILGCEMRFSENINDYLLFGIDTGFFNHAYNLLGDGLENFSKDFRCDDTLIIQAHPFRDGMTDVSPELIDGIEAFNMHPGHNSRIGFSAKHAAKHDFIITCGTDYHQLGHEGMCALLTKEPIRNSGDAARVLRSRDYLFEIGGTVVLPYGFVPFC